MFSTPEQFAAANKASVEAVLALANTALSSAERIAALHFHATRTLLEDGTATTKALLGAGDPLDAVALATAQLQPALEQLLTYGRSLCETSALSKDDVSRLFASQFDDFEKQAAHLIDQAARNAPPGSGVAMAALRSALEAARSAFEHMKMVLRQAAELDEANITTASNATVTAFCSATAGRKGSAR